MFGQKPNRDRTWRKWVVRIRAILDTVATLVVIAASAAVIFVVTSTWQRIPPNGQGQEPTPPQAPQTLEGAHMAGDRAAKVAIIQYSDFQCPFCGKFSRETWPALKEEYIGSGKVLMAFRHFPLKGIHPFAVRAAENADCAGRQGKFWEMHDLLFEQQSQINESALDRFATSLGLDASQFAECQQGVASTRVRLDEDLAATLGLSGTPTFLIGTVQPDKTVKVAYVLTGAQPLIRFKTILDQLLGAA